METVMTGLTNGLGSVANDVTSAFGTILPYALGVAGAVIAITLGIKLFKRVAK